MSSIENHETKHYNRNKGSSFISNKGGRKDGVVESEVAKLFRRSKGDPVSQQDLLRLRNKYDDQELVDQIQEAFFEKQNEIKRRAGKFAKLIRERYSDANYPFHKLLAKALKYKKKYNLSDDEFAEFKRQYEQDLGGSQTHESLLPNTNLSKVLGRVSIDTQGSGFKVSDDDYRVLQELLRLHEETRPLHAQIILQSLTYTDCAFEAVSGEYRPDLGHNPGCHIHPVIAAMFLPKLQVFEDHFLFANIGGIVKARFEKASLRTKPDYELFYSLVTDPNDVICDSASAIKDLLNRANLQRHLWNSVLHLRNGQYFNCSTQEFLMAVDMCKLNKYDTPDLVYGRYDGTVVKRLIAAFSFRPTVVATTPIYSLVTSNPYVNNVVPVVTSLPMINLRLPSAIHDQTPVNLSEALEQSQWFMENGQIVPKNQSLIYSRGVLIFYVDRRSHILRVGDNQPFNFNRLPAAIAGFERLNDRKVHFDPSFKIRDDEYELRSVVICETNNKMEQSKQVIIGSSTLIMKHQDPENNVFDSEYLKYDPLGVRDSYVNANTGATERNGPVTIISGHPDLTSASGSQNFTEESECRGTIFIYQLKKDSSQGVVQY